MPKNGAAPDLSLGPGNRLAHASCTTGEYYKPLDLTLKSAIDLSLFI
jgi:hypothetical protein